MKEFILTLIGVSLVSGFASMLSPDGKGEGLRSYLNLACALCALSVSVGPILSFIGVLTNGKEELLFGATDESAVCDFQAIFEETVGAEGEKTVEGQLKSFLCDEFGISPDNVDIDARFSEREDCFEVELVTVTLRGRDVLLDAHTLADCVEDILSCECRVVYGGRNG